MAAAGSNPARPNIGNPADCSVCRSLPFGVAIAVPLALTITVALVGCALLRELGLPSIWANVGGAPGCCNRLEPKRDSGPPRYMCHLALLWPFKRYASTIGAGLHGGCREPQCRSCTEQVICALPLAAALVAAGGERRRAAVVSSVVGALVVASFMLWPGANPRLSAGLIERIGGLTVNPAFYVGYPAVGLGLHSIPLAVRWAWPWDVGIAGGGGGDRMADRSARGPLGSTDHRLQAAKRSLRRRCSRCAGESRRRVRGAAVPAARVRANVAHSCSDRGFGGRLNPVAAPASAGHERYFVRCWCGAVFDVQRVCSPGERGVTVTRRSTGRCTRR